MKSTLLAVTLFLATLNAAIAFDPPQAKDTLTCIFTEPFLTITYNASSGEVIYLGAENYDVPTDQIIPVVLATSGSLVPVLTAGETIDTFYSIQGSQFELLANDGSLILKLTLSMNGSDGMSDRVYPFDAEYNGLQGGCDTIAYPAVDTISIYEGLKK